EGDPRHLLHQIGLHVYRGTVAPLLARMENERDAGEGPSHVRQRVFAVEGISLRVESPDVGSICPAGEPGRMPREVADGDLAARRLQIRPAGTVAPGVDAYVRELRSVARERIVQVEQTALVQLHERHAGDRLCHGEDLHDGIPL